MVRTSRLALRLFLLIVLAMALLGAWYTASRWQIQPESLDLSAYTEGMDWIDLVSTLGEEAIQLFMGITSGGS